MNYLLILLSCLLVSDVYSYSYKILVVFPYPGTSHTILGAGYVRHLLKAGHVVTYITGAPLKPHPKLRQIDVSSNKYLFERDLSLDLEKLLKNEVNHQDLSQFYWTMFKIGNRSITHENVQHFLMTDTEKYDLVISEWLYTELYCGFASIFNVPYIWSSSIEPHAMIMSLIDEIHNTAYAPVHSSPTSPPFTFRQRVEELWNILKLYYVRWSMKDEEEKAFRDAYGAAAKKRGVPLPTLYELKHNSSMIIGNSHVSLGLALRLPQNYIPVAGYHIDDEVQALSTDLQKIMDDASNGVIYFSLGSMLKGKTMPNELKKSLIKIFGALKQTVIWKLEEELKDLPKNVHIFEWAPQQSILAHPNCILFITHGGLLSTTESLHFGVPIIGIPLFFDQYMNVLRAVQRGYALQVDLSYDMSLKLKESIDEILENPIYREKVKELSFIYHHRPVKPGDALVHWVEHVIKTQGAVHLRTPAVLVPLYHRLYLDLIALILFIFLTLVWIIKILLVKLKPTANILKKKNK